MDRLVPRELSVRQDRPETRALLVLLETLEVQALKGRLEQPDRRVLRDN